MSKASGAALVILLFSPAAPCQQPSSLLSSDPRDKQIFAGAAGPASPFTLTVPAKTVASVQVLSGIHSLTSHVDDPVKARLVQPIYVNGQVALPPGSILDGRITRIVPAGRMHHPAELVFRFEQITLPDGQSEPISAVLAALDNPQPPKTLLDAEGRLRGTRGLGWKGITGRIAAIGTFATARLFLASTSLATVLPASGVALVGYEVFWLRGNEVHLPPQTRCRIRLNYPVTVRVAW